MKNKIASQIHINASVEKVYSIWTDVEKWHTWTATIKKIEFIEDIGFQLGAKAKVVQPRLAPAIWKITEINKNKNFTWETKMLGVTITGKHVLKRTSNGTIAQQEIIYNGFLASMFHKMFFKLSNSYLTIEANGLKAKCES